MRSVDAAIKQSAGATSYRYAHTRASILPPASPLRGLSVRRTTLRSDPRSGVRIPVVACVSQRSQASLDLIPALFIVDGCTHDTGDVLGSSPLTDPPIYLGHQIIIEDYVNSHGGNISHDKATDRATPAEALTGDFSTSQKNLRAVPTSCHRPLIPCSHEELEP